MFLETLGGLTEIPQEYLMGGAIGAILAGAVVFALLLGIALYVYHSLAWQTIAKKLKYKYPWLAWIPFANISQILELGGFHWAWVFLLLIPILGWIAIMVLMIISYWRVFEKRNYQGWFGLAPLIPKIGGILYLVAIGFVAWKDKAKPKKK
jgi:hypothetical protein